MRCSDRQMSGSEREIMIDITTAYSQDLPMSARDGIYVVLAARTGALAKIMTKDRLICRGLHRNLSPRGGDA